MDYYVYFHVFNDNQEIFYIGKGTRNRYLSKERSHLWHSLTQDREYTPLIHKDRLSEDEAFTLEKKLIKEYSPIGNVLPGGRCASGITSSEYQKWYYTTDHGIERRRRASERMIKSNPMKSKFLREQQSVRNKGDNNFYHKLTEEQKEKHRRNVSKSKLGERNPRAVKILYVPSNKVYGSISECLREEKLTKWYGWYERKGDIVRR